MKKLLFAVFIASFSFAGSSCSAQDFYPGIPHTRKNINSVAAYRYQQHYVLQQEQAYLPVLACKERRDAAFHVLRPLFVRDHVLFMDAAAINRQIAAIEHTRSLLADLDSWLNS